MLKFLAPHPWLALASVLSLSCGGGDEVDRPAPVESVSWVGPAPELRIVAFPDGMHLVADESALQPPVSVHAVNPQSGDSVDGTAQDDGSLDLLIPGSSQDGYEVTLRKLVGVQRPQESLLLLAVPSLEETEAAFGPCNCADVRFPGGRTLGIVHRPLECMPGFCADAGCYPTLDAWQAELCARPANGAIVRRSGCGLIQFDFALGSDARGAYGNAGNPFYSFDAESRELVGFYSYSDTAINDCELAQPTELILGRAIGGPSPLDCAEVTSCIVCGSEPGVDGPACSD